MNINDRIKMLRDVKGITQKELADALMLRPATVSMIENNKAGVTDKNISIICKKFNISEEWLRDGVGDMDAPQADDPPLDVWAREVSDRMKTNKDFPYSVANLLKAMDSEGWEAIAEIVAMTADRVRENAEKEKEKAAASKLSIEEKAARYDAIIEKNLSTSTNGEESTVDKKEASHV